ncbi:hypothetical protein [Rhodovulum sulfidophilum]|uniref:hypothetical protein n=1 Tax=Rhodovulum sulfidophilum TaxID=35806 RepID=UPI0009513C89|nr:hypothetical protein [Rhodovulum sulfidophilum]
MQFSQADAPSDTTEQMMEGDAAIKADMVDPVTRTALEGGIAQEREPLTGGDGSAVQNHGVSNVLEPPERAETHSSEPVMFVDGPQAVCGGLRIDAEPWYDASLGDYGKVRIILPDGTRRDHRINGSAATQIVPGCRVVSARIRYQRSNHPYAELTIMEETSR